MKERREVGEGGGGGRQGATSQRRHSFWLRVLMLLVRTIMFAV